MRTINYTGILLLGLALGCTSTAKKNTGQAVVENTAVNKEVKEIPEDKLIVPGKQVGALYLGQDMKEVFARLGNANDGDAAMGSALAMWNKDSISVFSSYRDSNMVVKAAKQIAVGSAGYSTANHIHTGIKLSQLIDLHPGLKLSAVYVNEKSKDTLKIFDDVAAGIAFDVEQGRCSRIIVHAKDKSVQGTYLSMYPGWNAVRQ